MSLRAVEHRFTGATNPYSSTYDSAKTTLGDLINQYTGLSPRDKYAGPTRFGRDAALQSHYGLARPAETPTAVPGMYPHVVRWADKSGFYSTGTVAVANKAVTGTGTGWLADGVPVGARIGFGSTNPALITTWYKISAITSATSITLQDSAGTITAGTSFVIDKNLKVDWVFLADNAAATTNRRITLFTYDRSVSNFSWQGFITITHPSGTNATVRGMRAVYDTYTTGTVAVSGATVTGTSTTWSSDRIAIGSRIGFGSTDPTQISTWYYVNAVGSDTSITIQVNITASGTGGTAANLSIAGGTAYVIEDLRILMTQTNATATNGGLFMATGVAFDDFTVGGTTIPTGVSTDKLKASYWLADASTVTNTAGAGVAIEDRASWTVQYCHVLDTAGRVYKYNFRKALTLASGKDTTTLIFRTGVLSPVLQGTMSQTNNGRIGTLSHGPGSGVSSLYFVTTTRVYRVDITNGTTYASNATNWATDSMLEIPTGDISTYTPSSVLSGVEIADQIDRLIVTGTGAASITAVTYTTGTVAVSGTAVTGSGTTFTTAHVGMLIGFGTTNPSLVTTWYLISAFSSTTGITLATSAGTIGAGSTFVIHYNPSGHNRSFITQYSTSGAAFDLPFGIDIRQMDQSSASNDVCPTPCPQGLPLSVWSEAGLVYICRGTPAGTAGTALTNQLYAVPLGADWDFASGTVKQRLITPSLDTSNAWKLMRVVVNCEESVGGGALALPTEGYRVYYRTSGITDDSGSWTLVDSAGDLTGATTTNAVQFMFEFRTIGTFCVPARIFSVTCLYEDESTDSHFEPSVAHSSIANKRFAWRYSRKFGGTVPDLRIELFNAVSGASIISDDSVSQTGTWEKSTDNGASWVTYDSADALNSTTYLRYTRSSLTDGLKVRALLTQL